MSRGAYAYRDLDEEIFAPPECTHYQSHSSPVQQSPGSKSCGLSESVILRRHLTARRERRSKLVLLGGITIMLLSTVLLFVLSNLPPPDKSSLELIAGAPYGALRRGDGVRGQELKHSASAPVDQMEAAAAAKLTAGERHHRRHNGAGPGVGDEDPYDPQVQPLDTIANEKNKAPQGGKTESAP